MVTSTLSPGFHSRLIVAHWPGLTSARCACPFTFTVKPFDQPGTRSLRANVDGRSIVRASVLVPASGYCVICTKLTAPAGPFHSTSEGTYRLTYRALASRKYTRLEYS